MDLTKKYQAPEVMDGCTAAAHVAYFCSEAAYIYPITPSTASSEVFENWSAQNRKNIFQSPAMVRQLQSEAGAAGAVHGSLSVGTLTTTFTASQGLLLMIPPMYKMAGELLPCVIHVPARAIAGQALSIFGDHSDVMACRGTGFALISSMNVQEAMDMALIAHMSTLTSSIPFLHFFDGFRTSHELMKINVLTVDACRELCDHEAIAKFRSRALNPTHPYQKGSSQGPEVFMQNQELSNTVYNATAGHVEAAMEKFGDLIGRKYRLFDYFGDADAESVVVLMGAGAPVIIEVMEHFKALGQGKSWGVVVCRLFRPWRADRLLEAIPKTCKRLAVLDRTKENGAQGEPLYLDVCTSLKTSEEAWHRNLVVLGGRYGLGSRDFTPPQVLSIFENLEGSTPKSPFTVGIVDDVTHLSLPYAHHNLFTVPANTTECLFWGMGSDGTVGANKNVIKIIGMNTEMYAQGYFAYSAYKAGGLTLSHLRFGPEYLHSSYLIQKATYVACHRSQYLYDFDVCEKLGDGGIFVLNAIWTAEELEQHIPNRLKRQLAQRNAKFYVIDANKVAVEVGMGRRVNSILMTVFFKVSGVLPMEKAIKLFKDAIQKTYGKKGPAVVEANWNAVDAACERTYEFPIPAHWKEAPADQYDEAKQVSNETYPVGSTNHFNQSIIPACAAFDQNLPVSAFQGYEGGRIPMGTTVFEKRGIALNVPVVDMDKCTQCNYCSFVCPHAAIRPFLISEEEAAIAPAGFDMRKSKGAPEIASYKYRIQVAPMDCTGCELCSLACPDEALTMTPLHEAKPVEEVNWAFAIENCPERARLLPGGQRFTLKGSQFYQPLLEFSGACEGCGETPYVKLLTQMFGEHLVIANATGCSSIWGASYPANPYTVNEKGYGPAWGNSLFEDNAEYGYGMVVSIFARRKRLHEAVTTLVAEAKTTPVFDEETYEELERWLGVYDNDKIATYEVFEAIKNKVVAYKGTSFVVDELIGSIDLIPQISVWIIGGDGWAFDIGFGGLDHVVASGVDVNILVLDTEVYSNTGGQTSKATAQGAQHKFAMGGRTRNKKDLGMLLMEYGDIYVASCASSANMAQTVRCFFEAEAYKGPSVILAYSPCIEHNYIKPFSKQIEHCKLAVDSGYWPLYRYNPALADAGELPLQLDCKKLKADVRDLLEKENRFKSLKRLAPEVAAKCETQLAKWCVNRFEKLKFRADYGEVADMSGAGTDGGMVFNIIYGSETGNAEEVASRIGKQLKTREVTAKVQSFEELEIDDLKEMTNVLIVCSTAGQGEFPGSVHSMWEALEKEADKTCFSNLKFATFGLGDSSYIYYNECAKKLDTKFAELGATRYLEIGMGDDQHEEKYETGLGEWLPEFYTKAEVPEPKNVSEVPDATVFKCEEVAPGKYTQCTHYGTKLVNIDTMKRITPADYEVNVIHMEYDLTGTGIKYALGDSLAVWPQNNPEAVRAAVTTLGLNPEQWVKVSRAGKESNAKVEALVKKPLSVEQLFVECFDLFGKPPRSFYEALWKFVTDPAEKAEARGLLSAENKEAFVQMTNKETVSVFDMLCRYKSAKFTLEQLIDLVPLIKCRYYSIASSQRYVGETRLHLCVGVVDWKDSLGRQRFGGCTGMFQDFCADFSAPRSVCASIKATAFHLPPTEENPVMMAGMGTGLAPFRAFLQHKAWCKDNNIPIGPVVLYFGCRYEAKDFLYAEELKKYNEDGVISELRVAFSRDNPKHRFYVQNHISKEPELFHTRFHKQNGYFYLCGSAKQVPIDIKAAVVGVMEKCEGWDSEKAQEYVNEQVMKGRYNVEAW